MPASGISTMITHPVPLMVDLPTAHPQHVTTPDTFYSSGAALAVPASTGAGPVTVVKATGAAAPQPASAAVTNVPHQVADKAADKAPDKAAPNAAEAAVDAAADPASPREGSGS